MSRNIVLIYIAWVCWSTLRYKGKEVSVMGSGMGIPSIGIYSYELYNFFDVDTIIRIGSCGALQENVNLYDIIIAQGASTNSSYVDQYNIPGHYAPLADFDLSCLHQRNYIIHKNRYRY